MVIELFHCTSEDNAMYKNLDSKLTLTGSLRNETDVVNPVILIEGNVDSISEYYNYAHIPSFNRSYFIREIRSVRTNILEISLAVDVLMSFRYEILANKVIINKSDNELWSNIYYDDGSFITESRDFYTIKTFEDGFNDTGEFILITAGGGGTVQGGE